MSRRDAGQLLRFLDRAPKVEALAFLDGARVHGYALEVRYQFACLGQAAIQQLEALAQRAQVELQLAAAQLARGELLLEGVRLVQLS